MKIVVLAVVGSIALMGGAVATAAAVPATPNRTVRLENQSHHSIVSVSYDPLTGPEAGSSYSFEVPHGAIPPDDYENLNMDHGGSCLADLVLELDGGKIRRVQLKVNVCKAGRWVILDTVDYVELGGYGKGPVIPHKVPAPLLTEADIQPCNELLSYRSAMYKDNTEQSNLDFALNNPPYEPLYDLKGTREFLASGAESIAAVESGSDAAQEKIFGAARFTGQRAVERLTTDRRFQCMLNVRLRQLQGKGSH